MNYASGSNHPTIRKLNWELAETLELDITEEDKILLRKNGEPIEKSLFKPVYQKQVNGLEKDMAWYLDSDKAISGGIASQCIKTGTCRAGSVAAFILIFWPACMMPATASCISPCLKPKDCTSKATTTRFTRQKLFELLTLHSQSALTVGELKLGLKQQQIRFDLMLENNWREKLPCGTQCVILLR